MLPEPIGPRCLSDSSSPISDGSLRRWLGIFCPILSFCDNHPRVSKKITTTPPVDFQKTDCLIWQCRYFPLIKLAGFFHVPVIPVQ